MSGARVPKFGSWDDKDIPYTTYFENARKDRTRGFNPNDPEENPEAFTPSQPVQKQDSREEQHRSSVQRESIDQLRTNAKSKPYNEKSRSNASVPTQPPHISRSLTPINASPASSVSSSDKGSVHQKPATLSKLGSLDEKDPKRGNYHVINNEVKQKKENGTNKLSPVPAKQRTFSKEKCCFFTFTRK